MDAYDAGFSRAARAYEWNEDTWAAGAADWEPTTETDHYHWHHGYVDCLRETLRDAPIDKRPALVARIRETEHPMLSILLRLPE